MTNKNTGTKEPSSKKAAANRKNAMLSTGPRSPEGKSRSSLNALKHGFFAMQPLLASEDPGEYQAFRDALWSDLDPKNTLEVYCVMEIINTCWRMRRLGLIEAEIFTRRAISFSGDDCGPGFSFIQDSQGLNAFTKLSQYESALGRRVRWAFEEFRKLRERHQEKTPTTPSDAGTAVDVSSVSVQVEASGQEVRQKSSDDKGNIVTADGKEPIHVSNRKPSNRTENPDGSTHLIGVTDAFNPPPHE